MIEYRDGECIKLQVDTERVERATHGIEIDIAHIDAANVVQSLRFVFAHNFDSRFFDLF